MTPNYLNGRRFPSQTTNDPMFSSAILRIASNTVSSKPTLKTLWPFSPSNFRSVVMGECPSEMWRIMPSSIATFNFVMMIAGVQPSRGATLAALLDNR
jgi:hypothetical protein